MVFVKWMIDVDSNIIVLGASFVGGIFILRVVWNVAVERFLKHSNYDGIDTGDGNGYIWK